MDNLLRLRGRKAHKELILQPIKNIIWTLSRKWLQNKLVYAMLVRDRR